MSITLSFLQPDFFNCNWSMYWQNGFPKAQRIRGRPRYTTLTHHFSHHQEAFPSEKKLKSESMKLPAGVIYNSLWCGIFKDTFSKGWPENSKMLQHVPHLIEPRTLPPSFPILHILDVKNKSDISGNKFPLHLQNLFGILLEVEIYDLKPYKISSEITLNILYSYCSYLWVLFLPKWIPNKVKLSQHI